jgi:hypothetical protein
LTSPLGDKHPDEGRQPADHALIAQYLKITNLGPLSAHSGDIKQQRLVRRERAEVFDDNRVKAPEAAVGDVKTNRMLARSPALHRTKLTYEMQMRK